MACPLNAQIKHSHEVVFGNLQIKEQRNSGMVFNGIQLEYRYGVLWKINKHEMLYQPKLGLGIGFNRGMIGLQLPKIAPINVTWLARCYEQNGHTIKAGANLITDYSYQLYPDLHIGSLFFASEIGISPVFRYNYQWSKRRFGIYLQNSLFGFTSHTQEYDSYWFSLKAREWFVEPHKNLKFGSFDKYNHTTVSFEFVPNIEKKHSILYELDYFGSYYGMKFSRLNHNLIWRIALCKK
jgi:hypothetical protein